MLMPPASARACATSTGTRCNINEYHMRSWSIPVARCHINEALCMCTSSSVYPCGRRGALALEPHCTWWRGGLGLGCIWTTYGGETSLKGPSGDSPSWTRPLSASGGTRWTPCPTRVPRRHLPRVYAHCMRCLSAEVIGRQSQHPGVAPCAVERAIAQLR